MPHKGTPLPHCSSQGWNSKCGERSNRLEELAVWFPQSAISRIYTGEKEVPLEEECPSSVFYSTRMRGTGDTVSWPSPTEWQLRFFLLSSYFWSFRTFFFLFGPAWVLLSWSGLLLERRAFPISVWYSVAKMQFHEYEFINTSCPITPPISFIFFPAGSRSIWVASKFNLPNIQTLAAQEECGAALASPRFPL